jgi:hypothetical protein
MRVEAAPFVVRSQDRRKRDAERRTQPERRISAGSRAERRAHLGSNAWIMPAFGAHLIGQGEQQVIPAETVTRAYSQPESRMPIRPHQARMV